MKFGLVSAILDGWTMEEMLDVVSGMGFECVEVACWPQGKAERRYAGVSHIDVARVLEDDQYAKYVLDSFAAKKVEISSLAFYPNTMDGDLEKRAAAGLVPVQLRLDDRAAAVIDGTPVGETDFDTEFLDYILAVRVVADVEEAISHIAAHSTMHSEASITADEQTAARFTAAVDAAAVYVNASTRFTDGGEFGLGCEMGISTQKMHARGPLGIAHMVSSKYIISGNGQIR